MATQAGFYLPLSPPRRLMNDYLHFARQVPPAAVEREMSLGRLRAARELASPRPGWCAVFTKAWAIVCANTPALRRSLVRFPWARLYQHAVSVAAVAVERHYGDETGTFFRHVPQPETMAVLDLDRTIRRFKDCPPASSGGLQRQLTTSSRPWAVRRALWWLGLNVSGGWRGRFFGTFAVATAANLGAGPVAVPTLLTTTLSYGVVGKDGRAAVRVTYDPRVVDGGTVARALDDLERVLTCDLTAELRYLESLEAAA